MVIFHPSILDEFILAENMLFLNIKGGGVRSTNAEFYILQINKSLTELFLNGQY